MSNYIKFIFLIALLPACNAAPEVTTTSENTTFSQTLSLTEAQFANAGIEVGTIQKMAMSTHLSGHGIIEVPPQNRVSVSVPLGGYLISTSLIQGMQVNKGQVLATLEDQQYIQLQQDYLIAKSQLVTIEADFERQKQLNQSKASSDRVFQLAESEFTSKKIVVRALAEKLRLIGINPSALNETTLSKQIQLTSPIDGFVMAVNHNPGKYIGPTDVIFELVDPREMHLSLTMFEKDLDKLKIGQTLSCYSNAFPEVVFNAVIILIDPNVSGERTVQVKCKLDGPIQMLTPGMYMNAQIDINSLSEYAITTEALVQYDGSQFVFKQNESLVFKMVKVDVKNSDEQYTQIVLPDTSQMSIQNYVLKGAYTLLMKMKNTEE